jgi:ADP-heptose:LPS heptosyltransferase
VKNKKIHRILIIQTASIGDVVLATPVAEKLSIFFPDAAIDFLVKRGIEKLLVGNPKLRQILIWDKSKNKFRELRYLTRELRSNNYDVVINLQRFASTGLLTVLSGAQIKLGFRKNPFSVFFTKAVKHRISDKPKESAHEVHRNLSVIDLLTDAGRNYPPRLYPSQADFAKVSQFKTHRYITVSPASLWFTKQFPAEKWVEFLQEVDKTMHVYMLGGKADFVVCQQIMEASGLPNSINLAGKLTFLESAALMKDAAMNYVNDSAPMHFTSAMNAAVTAIFCSTVPAFGFTPLSDNAAIVETDQALDCRPCGLHGYNACPEKHFKCAQTINKEKLLDTIR